MLSPSARERVLGLDGLQITRAAGARGAPDATASKPTQQLLAERSLLEPCNAGHVQTGGFSPAGGTSAEHSLRGW